MSILRRFRSTRTGRWVNKTQADANQDTTIAETARQHALSESVVRAVQHCIERNGVEGTLERLAD